MTGKLKSILSIVAFAMALAMAPMSVAFAAGDLGLEFDVLDDSDSEEGSILELQEAEDSDSEDVDSEDSDSEDSDSEDSDSEDSDDDLDDSDSEDDSEEDMIEE